MRDVDHRAAAGGGTAGTHDGGRGSRSAGGEHASPVTRTTSTGVAVKDDPAAGVDYRRTCESNETPAPIRSRIASTHDGVNRPAGIGEHAIAPEDWPSTKRGVERYGAGVADRGRINEPVEGSPSRRGRCGIGDVDEAIGELLLRPCLLRRGGKQHPPEQERGKKPDSIAAQHSLHHMYSIRPIRPLVCPYILSLCFHSRPGELSAVESSCLTFSVGSLRLLLLWATLPCRRGPRWRVRGQRQQRLTAR